MSTMSRARIVPSARPRLSAAKLREMISPFGIDRDRYPLIVVGIRGYYRDSMGAPGCNDLNIYDDAGFIDSPNATIAVNFNTDPARRRPGYGTAEATKGMAHLKPGVYYAHRFGLHRGQYLALVQTAGPVTVVRDGLPGKGDYEDIGYFGINIHRGGRQGTSSLGCQTVPPEQWGEFIALLEGEARRLYGAKWKTSVVPYVLLEEAV